MTAAQSSLDWSRPALSGVGRLGMPPLQAVDWELPHTPQLRGTAFFGRQHGVFPAEPCGPPDSRTHRLTSCCRFVSLARQQQLYRARGSSEQQVSTRDSLAMMGVQV
jgi:hypothetical protein